MKFVARALLVALLCTFGTDASLARSTAPAQQEVALVDLPQEARDTLALIRRGGPFRYPQDGSVFGNRERRLPAKQRGYYREYTVPTPGAKDRGARRIVTGLGPGDAARTSGEYYYSDDHYNSFRRIKE
jgi:ribonuclease T1